MWSALLSHGLRRLLRPDPRWFRAHEGPSVHGLELTYLGTAGFVLRSDTHTIALE